MANLSGQEKSIYVRKMFGRIAPRYDLLNRLMTMGQDVKWRKDCIQLLDVSGKKWVVDLGTGTGDIAYEIKRQFPEANVVASDLTLEMVLVGKKRPGGDRLLWVIADAQNLPFADLSFQGVISGYLLRNVPDVDCALSEQFRILENLGSVVSLDTTPPRHGILKPFLDFYLHYVIPFLGRVVSGDSEAYVYLPSSTEQFLTAETLKDRFQLAGFSAVKFARRMLGTMAIHWARKDAGGQTKN